MTTGVLKQEPDVAEGAIDFWFTMGSTYSYLSVMRLATVKPDAEDRPGAVVNNARRRRDGGGVGEDQASDPRAAQ